MYYTETIQKTGNTDTEDHVDASKSDPHTTTTDDEKRDDGNVPKSKGTV